jgi:hypothetical protein
MIVDLTIVPSGFRQKKFTLNGEKSLGQKEIGFYSLKARKANPNEAIQN